MKLLLFLSSLSISAMPLLPTGLYRTAPIITRHFIRHSSDNIHRLLHNEHLCVKQYAHTMRSGIILSAAQQKLRLKEYSNSIFDTFPKIGFPETMDSQETNRQILSKLFSEALSCPAVHREAIAQQCDTLLKEQRRLIVHLHALHKKSSLPAYTEYCLSQKNAFPPQSSFNYPCVIKNAVKKTTQKFSSTQHETRYLQFSFMWSTFTALCKHQMHDTHFTFSNKPQDNSTLELVIAQNNEEIENFCHVENLTRETLKILLKEIAADLKVPAAEKFDNYLESLFKKHAQHIHSEQIKNHLKSE